MKNSFSFEYKIILEYFVNENKDGLYMYGVQLIE